METRQPRILGIVTFLLIGIVLLIPRFALVTNGVDAGRNSDTYMGDTLSFLSALSGGEIKEYLSSGHKYPLLGSYMTAVPVVIYYGYERVVRTYDSPEDFVRAYALKESNVLLFVRIFMMVLGLLAILLLAKLTKIHDKSKRAHWYVLLLSGLSFYITSFSVAPRVHHLVFVFVTLTLGLSLRYYRDASMKNAILAFSAAGLSFAVSQSGAVAFALPMMAHLLPKHGEASRPILKRVINKNLFAGLALFVALSLSLGYPQVIAGLVGDGVNSAFLGAEHSQPTFAISNLARVAQNSIFHTEFALSFVLIVLTAYVVVAYFRKHKLPLDNLDYIAMAPIVLFILIFGTSSVLVGRFVLVIYPPLLFIAARFIGRFRYNLWFIIPLSVLLLVQGLVVGNLTKAALGGDVRAHGAKALLELSGPEDHILSSINNHSLGIPVSPIALSRKETQLSRTDSFILDKELLGNKSRDFTYFVKEDSPNFSEYDYIVLHKYEFIDLFAEPLADRGFELIWSSSATDKTRRDSLYFNWDDFGGYENIFALRHLSAFGPPIYIYEK